MPVKQDVLFHKQSRTASAAEVVAVRNKDTAYLLAPNHSAMRYNPELPVVVAGDVQLLIEGSILLEKRPGEHEERPQAEVHFGVERSLLLTTVENDAPLRSGVRRILLDTMVLTGVVCLLVGAASCFSWILAAEQVPKLLGDFMGWVGGERLVFLLLSVGIFFLFGMILDGLPAIIIFFPILFPLAQALGIHPLHFGVLVIAVVGISVVAPPVGICLVIICSIGKIRVTETYRPSLPYVLVLVVDLVVMAFWPWLVLFLPQAFRL